MMKLDSYCSLVDAQIHQQQSQFSPAAQPNGFGAFSPVSDEPSPDQRLSSVASCEYEASAAADSFHGMPLVESYGTPRSSAAMSDYYYMGDLQQPQASMAAVTTAAVAPQMTSGYMTTSRFGQAPATPDRNSSVSSRNSNMSPTTPNVMGSYSSSVTTPGSAVSAHSQNMLCGTGSPEAYFSDIHQQHQQHRPSQMQHAHAFHQHAHPHAYRDEASPAYVLSTPGHVMTTPSPAQDLRGDNANSPTDYVLSFRTESPIKDYFGERSMNLPPPPPSATLPSSIRNDLMSYTPEEMDRRYSSASSTSSYGSAAMGRQFSRLNDVRRNSEALQRISSQQYDYNHYADHSAAAGGHVMVRNGIRVSKVASGAFKCMVPGCPSRPFKRSEHLKRHVTTHHENKDLFPCEFCGRHFNRKDNWRSHLKLHTISRGKNARTDYFPRALDVYNDEMRKISKSRPRKDKD